MKPVLLLSSAVIALIGLCAFAAPRAAGSADPVVGDAHSSVRVIIYQDLECPDCARWHKIFTAQIIPQFGAKVGFEFRDYPLPQHLWSFNAAVLARYFDTKSLKLGLDWRDYCFTHQDEFTPANLLSKAAQWAQPQGITAVQLEDAFANPELFAKVQADQQLGRKDNVQHTPTILLNGHEATTPEQLEQWLAQAGR